MSENPEKKRKWYSIRKQVLLIPLVFVLIIAFVAWWYHLPVGEGPAGPSVPAEPFQKVWKEQKVLIVAFGDSISTGFGGKRGGYIGRLMKAKDDVEDMKGKNLSRVFPNLELQNFACNAACSISTLNGQLPPLKKQSPDVFGIGLVTVGGIDLIHNYGKAKPQDGAIYGARYEEAVKYGKKFRKRLEKLLDGIKERFPGGCEIFLANIYDPTDTIGDIENVHPLLRMVMKLPPWPDGLKILKLWNQHIQEAADARDFVHVVDIYSLMLGHGIHCRDTSNPHYRPKDPHYWYYFNLEDPNHRGYDAIRRVFLLKMIDVFYKKKK